jgi:SAM-dependent methyltransferase
MQATSIADGADTQTSDAQAQDELRPRLHCMWAHAAEGWAELAEEVDSRSALLTEKLLALSEPKPGELVLELACGPGGAGLAAAERAAPGGEVALTDVAEEMTAIASARAKARGIENVTTRVRDLERIDGPDSSYDVALCREGLMLVPDPARAVREIRRVPRPGGRAALAVWGPRERNPRLGVMFDAISDQLGCPVPPAGIPGPFSLQDADKLAALLADARLSDVAVSDLSVRLDALSFEEWWKGRCALAGSLTQILASVPEDAVRGIRARAREATMPYETARGLDFPGGGAARKRPPHIASRCGSRSFGDIQSSRFRASGCPRRCSQPTGSTATAATRSLTATRASD